VNIGGIAKLPAMSKKSKFSKQKKNIVTQPSQADKLFGLISLQIVQGNYTEAVSNSERLLRYLPQHSPLRVETLAHLGTAHAMLQNYPESYKALTEALALNPNDPDLWYNRGLASRFTSRFGRSYRDFERAVELNVTPELKKQFNEGLKSSRKMAQMSMKSRGPGFTLDQLIEQENHFQHGMETMQARKWEEAIQAFEAAIAMGDCLPQPWGNLGMCLMMLERYDDAEAAWKHALTIDRHYAIAKNNLAKLPETRRDGPPQVFGISDPFVNSNIKQGITFIEE
jgi:tetratricopeptide (TPR) repeat protein